MELVTLDDNFQPAELVERSGSLIWTERYSIAGDFELTTTDVERMLNLLPLESYVSIRESTVPMIVESHKIGKTKQGAPTLLVKGRSFETVLERRAAVKTNTGKVDSPRIEWFEQRGKPSDAAFQVIRQIIGDVAHPPKISGSQVPILSAKDTIPEIELILPADYDISTINTYEIKPGNLYSVVLELINANHHGLKAVRPDKDGTKVGIEIYNGANLATDPDPSVNVVFNARFDQFEESTYLLSYAGSTNWAYVFSKTDAQEVEKNLVTVENPEPSGLDRRVLLVDITNEEGVETPEARKTRGLIELYKNNATALFDGKIAEQVAAGYNRDYFLGDIIRLDGEYGLSENVRVAEFIRSDDSTGSKAYPTFEVADG